MLHQLLRMLCQQRIGREQQTMLAGCFHGSPYLGRLSGQCGGIAQINPIDNGYIIAMPGKAYRQTGVLLRPFTGKQRYFANFAHLPTSFM
jgi:hypothetical protein